MADKAAGKHVNTRDIKKHRSDVLKNVVILEDDVIKAPTAIVEAIRDFVTSATRRSRMCSSATAAVLSMHR